MSVTPGNMPVQKQSGGGGSNVPTPTAVNQFPLAVLIGGLYIWSLANSPAISGATPIVDSLDGTPGVTGSVSDAGHSHPYSPGSIMALIEYLATQTYTVTATTLATGTLSPAIGFSFTTAAVGPGSTEVLIEITAAYDNNNNNHSHAMQVGFTGTGAPAATAYIGFNWPVNQIIRITSELLVTGLTPNTAYTWDLASFVSSGGQAQIFEGATEASGQSIIIKALAGLS